MDKLYLSDIYIYPIKSLGGIRLEKSLIEEKGLQYDRRWMLVDHRGTFITQRKYAGLSMLQVGIENKELFVQHKANNELRISFPIEQNTNEKIAVSIWDNSAHGVEVSKAVSQWFSDYLQFEVKLVKLPEEERIPVDPRYATKGEIVSFSDGYPCLIIGQSSMDFLNEKLDQPVKMNRFRPNFVFAGGTPHFEDQIKTFSLGEIMFSAVKPCARCVLITVDQESGIKSQEPLKTLATYRTLNNKIMFGQNLVHQGTGYIRVGDELKVETYQQPVH